MLMRHCFFEIRVLKTATCPNKSVSIFLQSMCLPFPSQLQGLSHSSWLGLLAGNSVQTFWSKQFLTWCYSNEYIYIYIFAVHKTMKKNQCCAHYQYSSRNWNSKKVRWNCFFCAIYIWVRLCDWICCMICCQAMWLALYIHMMRKDAHGKGEGTGASEGWQASEK